MEKVSECVIRFISPNTSIFASIHKLLFTHRKKKKMSFKLKILIVFVAALTIQFIGSTITNLTLMNVYPTAPKWLVFAFPFFIFIPILYFLYFKNKENDFLQNSPFLQENKTYVIIATLLGCVLSGIFINHSLTSIVYFDNGKKNDATLVYTDREGKSQTVALPHSKATEIELPIGNVKFTINGKPKEIVTIPDTKFIFNIDTANAYVLTEEYYGEDQTAQDFKPKFEAIKKEFFRINVDYLFEAPDSIFVKKNEKKTKTILYRVNDDKSSE